MPASVNIYKFDLDFTETYSKFYFCYNNKKIDNIVCILSGLEAKDMNYEYPDKNPNRAALFEKLKIQSEYVFAFKQVHSRNVVLLEKESKALYKEADGIVSACKKHCLSVTAADCLPVYLFDTVSGAFSVVHSGWRGTGIAINALNIMSNKFKTLPADTAVVLGPCIQSCCYEVDKDRSEIFEKEFGIDSGEYPLGSVVKTKEGSKEGSKVGSNEKKYFIDMQAANAHILAKAGVKNIAVCNNCTYTDSRLGSYRRQGSASYTKMAALIGYTG
ncbi:MAG: peptidoglycan editing factor PgeF [Spirochaetaceae bacterium]|jgi:YfiH family protein|nr:peptidoglycan editing factor PgeF [Spirochaetaceae bacterium]